ncbi:MAG TPA: GyrI-like domain-containing protein [Burkholderiales bacterium]|nr:GyrI-like domain-containing protein [Burkholderiales bacterium]
MNVAIVERQPVTVASFRHVGPYGDAISRFWQQTVAPWMVANKLGAGARYGVSHDNPNATAPEQCRYDACVEVPPDFAFAGGAQKTTIAGGKYAVYQFKGTNADVFKAWREIMQEWLPSSGYRPDARPCFEYYPNGSAWDPKTGAFECEICVPVMSL